MRRCPRSRIPTRLGSGRRSIELQRLNQHLARVRRAALGIAPRRGKIGDRLLRVQRAGDREGQHVGSSDNRTDRAGHGHGRPADRSGAIGIHRYAILVITVEGRASQDETTRVRVAGASYLRRRPAIRIAKILGILRPWANGAVRRPANSPITTTER